MVVPVGQPNANNASPDMASLNVANPNVANPNVASLKMENSKIVSPNMASTSGLKSGSRKPYSDGKTPRPGKKLTYDPSINGNRAEYNDNFIDFRKITVVVPPSSRVEVTFTMTDGTTRSIAFENTDTVAAGLKPMRGRIYVDPTTGQFSIVENDIKSNKLPPGPVTNPFGTSRKLVQLKKGEQNVVLSGNATNGAQKKAQTAEKDVEQRAVEQRSADSQFNKTPDSTEVDEGQLGEKQPVFSFDTPGVPIIGAEDKKKKEVESVVFSEAPLKNT